VETSPLGLPGGKGSEVSGIPFASLSVLFTPMPCKTARKICHELLLISSCAEYNPIWTFIFVAINLPEVVWYVLKP